MAKKNLVNKIGDFFEISANVNLASVISYIGSAGLAFYNIFCGPNKYDGILLAVSGVSYAIYKKLHKILNI